MNGLTIDKVTVKVIQANLGRGRDATDELRELALDSDASILLIQEPYVYKNESTGLGRYTNQVLFTKKHDEPPWACFVITNKKYTATLLDHVSTFHCVCAHITGPVGSFYAISVYMQYSLTAERILSELHEILSFLGATQVVIGMDANAVSPLWSYRTGVEADDKGKVMEDFLAQWNLVPANCFSRMCTYRVGKRDIDLTLTDAKSSTKIIDWKVVDEPTSSDHRAILITMGEPTRPERIKLPGFIVKNSD